MTLPDPTRYAMDAARTIGADFADLDGGGGYLWKISRSGRTFLCGAGGVASFPINGASAFTISRDKSHTKSALIAAGLKVIPGGLFFAHQRRVKLRGPGREANDATAFAKRLGFPVFCKPNIGARGNFAEIVSDEAGLQDYARRVAAEFESFLIEPVIDGTEHRVLVHDGDVVFQSTKRAPVLIGDGRSTLGGLLSAANAALTGEGVSETPASAIAAAGRKASDVPAAGERITLPGRRNLSSAGEAEAVTTHVAPELASLAQAAVAALGLRIGAVDVFDVSAKRDLSDLMVIEVNGNPGLKTLELAGRYDLIQAIWVSMLEDMLEG